MLSLYQLQYPSAYFLLWLGGAHQDGAFAPRPFHGLFPYVLAEVYENQNGKDLSQKHPPERGTGVFHDSGKFCPGTMKPLSEGISSIGTVS